MARIKYFAEQNGQPVELSNVWYDGAVSFGYAPDGTKLQTVRKVEYKSFPTKHECDARCINATGRVMKCECKCGGKNHGRGAHVHAEGVA